MTKSRIVIKTFASLIFAFALCLTAQAQTRTFVSGTGSDGNPCTRISACRSFQHAHDVVVAGGEVIALDSAGYGPITITKSVTITGEGVYAGINTSSGDGVTIATSGIKVNLRSLMFEGLNSGTNGIKVTAVGILHVEGCVISGFTVYGIGVSLSADGHLFIKDTILRNNGSDGMNMTTTLGLVHVSIDNCRAERNSTYGFFFFNNTRVTINRSVASGNSGGGFSATTSGFGATAELNCEECVSNDNGQGFEVNALSSATATIRVSRSTATNNAGNGFVASNSGVFKSLVNNLVDGNGTETSGTITPITAK